MSNLDISSLSALLKTMYSTKKMQNLIFYSNPWYARIQKVEDWTGNTYNHPVIHSTQGGRSGNINNAISNAGTPGMVQLAITDTTNYGVAFISGRMLDAAGTNKNAFQSVISFSMDERLKKMRNDVAFQLFHDGSGVRGQIAASQSTSSSTLTLADATTAINFETGDIIVTSATADGTGVRNSGGQDDTFTVTAIDYDAGTLTLNQALNTYSHASANDYIYIQGDATQTGGATYNRMRGLDGWLPATAPTSGDSFFGIDRSVNPTRLAGIRHDGSGGTVLEAITSAALKAAKFGAKPDLCILSFSQYQNLALDLNSKGLQGFKGFQKGEIGFASIVANTPTGPIEIMPDRSCPNNVAYLVQEDTWYLLSRNGPVIKIDDYDGLSIHMDPNNDQYQVRIKGYGNVFCSAPGYNVRVTMPNS